MTRTALALAGLALVGIGWWGRARWTMWRFRRYWAAVRAKDERDRLASETPPPSRDSGVNGWH